VIVAMAGSVSTRRSVPIATSRSRNSPAVSSSSIGVAARANTAPVSRPFSISKMQTPVSASPARIARSTGAAPRQRGRSEKCTFTKPSGTAVNSDSGRSCPNATTTPTSAPLAATSSVTSRARSGVSTRSPSSSAAAFTGLGSVAPPRPRRRSGWVTTSRIS
jgi:hypothetical protein